MAWGAGAMHERHKQRHRVADVRDIPPGARKIVEIDGKSIGIFNVDDQLLAVRNLCPHEYGPVCLGRVGGTSLPGKPGEFNWGMEGRILACPWHGWEFDLVTGDCLTDKRKLKKYLVTIDDEAIWVEL
jgi:nitrite reductase/ring-hydroxylating ferredoxin subunit